MELGFKPRWSSSWVRALSHYPVKMPARTLLVFRNSIWESGIGRVIGSTELALLSLFTHHVRGGGWNCKNERERSCEGNFFPFMLLAGHSFQSLDRSSVLFYAMGSWGGGRTKWDGELSCLFIFSLLPVTWMKGEVC